MAKIGKNFDTKTALILLGAVFLFFVDRYLKNSAMSDTRYDIWGEWLRFGFTPNYGIAFSLPLGGVFLNIFIVFIIIGLVIWALKLYKDTKISQILAIIIVILGAVSNLADRLLHGYVIDYIDVKYFTVLNVADIMIFCGIVGVLIITNKKAELHG